MLHVFVCQLCGVNAEKEQRGGIPPRYCGDTCRDSAAARRSRERKMSAEYRGRNRLAEAKRMEDPAYRDRKRALAKTPAAQQRRRERDALPENRARIRQRNAEFEARPERKEYKRDLARKRWAIDPEFKGRRQALTSARYALTRGAAAAEKFTLDYIVQRDRSICHLCRKKVKRVEASMDHLIPVSLGGEHTKANVALAHLSCNSRKKTKAMGEQLALFG